MLSAKNKQDLEDAIDGVRIALGVLRDYNGGGDKAHEAAGEESTGIRLLAVFESDFSKNLAEISAAEEIAVVTCERQSKENDFDKAKEKM